HPHHIPHVHSFPTRRSSDLTWQSQGGDHIGNRGVGILGDALFFETPDCHLVSLDLKDGKERWRQTICDLNQYYFGTAAPIVVKKDRKSTRLNSSHRTISYAV